MTEIKRIPITTNQNNELNVFNNPEFGNLRTITIDNEPWFVGKDVAEALGYSDTYDAIKKHVDDEDKQNRCFASFESPRGMTIINESGMYSLILRSKLPAAKKFKRWVTSEVLLNARKLSNSKGLEPYEPHNETLVEVKNNQIVTDSRSIAEHFGKAHKNVLQAIDDLVAQNSATKNMFLEQTREYRGRDFRYYLVNRDGFSLLVMGFTGKAALEWKLKYIEAFNKMEKEIANKNTLALPDFTNPSEAARAWADEYDRSQKLLAQVTELKPKADYTDKVLKSNSVFPIRQIANEYDMTAQQMNKLLVEYGVIYHSKNRKYYCLYKKYRGMGYVASVTVKYEKADGTIGTSVNIGWTQSGRKFIHDLLAEHGILPVQEKNSKLGILVEKFLEERG